MALGDKLEDLFFDTDFLQIMYFLAKENPKITSETISRRLDISKDRAEFILSNIAFFNLAKMDEDKGYTLTPQGLTMLYNFHVNFNVGAGQ